MQGVENGILAPAMGGTIFIGADGNATPVANDKTSTFSLCPSHLFPGRIYVGCEGALYEHRFDPEAGHWVNKGVAANLNNHAPITFLLNTGRDDLWMTTIGTGLFRVRFAAGGEPAITSFFKEAGPMQGEGWVLVAATEESPLLVATRRRLYRFDEKAQGFTLASTYGSRFTDGSFFIDAAVPAGDGALWVAGSTSDDPSGQQICGRARPDGPAGAAAWQPLPR